MPEEEPEDEEELLDTYFFATYPFTPPALILYQLPLVERTSTVVPLLRDFSTLLSEDLLLRTFSEPAVTVPVHAKALSSGIRQAVRTRISPAFHFFKRPHLLSGKNPAVILQICR